MVYVICAGGHRQAVRDEDTGAPFRCAQCGTDRVSHVETAPPRITARDCRATGPYVKES
jgi:hypothetical protein